MRLCGPAGRWKTDPPLELPPLELPPLQLPPPEPPPLEPPPLELPPLKLSMLELLPLASLLELPPLELPPLEPGLSLHRSLSIGLPLPRSLLRTSVAAVAGLSEHCNAPPASCFVVRHSPFT